MTPVTLRRAFIAFHLALGLALLYASLRTAMTAMFAGRGHGGAPVAVLAFVEAGGALLLLFPRTVRPGGALLLLTLMVAIVAHAAMLEFRPDLLVYAAGTAFVMVHGSAWRDS